MLFKESNPQSIFWERNGDKILIFGITSGILLFLGIEYKNELVQLFSRLLDGSNKEELKSEIASIKIIQISDDRYIEYAKHVDVLMYVCEEITTRIYYISEKVENCYGSWL